jgi:hypothetical protein
MATKKNVNVHPVFKLKTLDKETVLCKHVGNIDGDVRFYDDPVELSEEEISGFKVVDKQTIIIGSIDKYSIFAKVCSCNISADVLLERKKYPIYYISFLYANQFVRGYLLNIYLNFTLTDECKASLIKPPQYINKRMYGKYTIEVDDEDKLMNGFLEIVEKTLLNKKFNENNNKFDLLSEDDQQLFVKNIMDDVSEELKVYAQIYEPHVITENFNKTTIIKQLTNYCTHPALNYVLTCALRHREQERKDKSCPDMEYGEIPKNIINLKDIKENPQKAYEIDVISECSDYD